MLIIINSQYSIFNSQNDPRSESLQRNGPTAHYIPIRGYMWAWADGGSDAKSKKTTV